MKKIVVLQVIETNSSFLGSSMASIFGHELHIIDG